MADGKGIYVNPNQRSEKLAIALKTPEARKVIKLLGKPVSQLTENEKHNLIKLFGD